MLGARITVTDMVSPAPETLAGQQLEQNMRRLRDAGGSQDCPLQMASAFQWQQPPSTGPLHERCWTWIREQFNRFFCNFKIFYNYILLSSSSASAPHLHP